MDSGKALRHRLMASLRFIMDLFNNLRDIITPYRQQQKQQQQQQQQDYYTYSFHRSDEKQRLLVLFLLECGVNGMKDDSQAWTALCQGQ